jgi:disulfide bond formation protein DsbB
MPATKPCPFCAEQIAAVATVCPRCGRSIDFGRSRRIAIIVFGLIVITGAIVGAVFIAFVLQLH